jgi:DNA invertase Pin-like site-specific DNA recombinase
MGITAKRLCSISLEILLAMWWPIEKGALSNHLISAVDEFRHLGIEFISYQENIDTASPLGKAMCTIVAAIAELERNIIVERIRGGIRRAREQGKRLGRRPLTDPSLLRTALQMEAQGRCELMINL